MTQRIVMDRARITDGVRREVERGPYPAELDAVLPAAAMAAARAEIVRWPGYAPTPLAGLDRLARTLGVDDILYKDESARFGLGSFKALGGAYAVVMLLAGLIEDETGTRPDPAEIREGRHRDTAATITVVTATDGNHGRSVAWGARMTGCNCRIYIHAGVSEGRARAMAELGAEVVRIDGDYDDSLRRCAEEAAANGWHVVSDTSYEGYMELPRQVMAGYAVLSAEILGAVDLPPTHVFVQGGVGGLAAALCAQMWSALGPERPTFVAVEPDRAPCLLESARQNRAAAVGISQETVMAGLSCGEASLLAWEILSRGAEHFLAINDDAVGPAMRALASGELGGGPIEAGESAVAGLIALDCTRRDATLREILGLDAGSRVVLIGTEGATDPAIYRAIVEGREAAHG